MVGQATAVRENTIDVSVVIVSWNTRDLLPRCLETIQREAHRDNLTVEVIVVDNASCDGTVALLRDQYPRVTLIALEQNVGFAAANNIGICQTQGSTVLLLNPDTELLPGSLGALFKALHAAPHVGLVGAVLLNADETLQAAGFRFPGPIQVLLDFFPVHPRLVGSRINGRIPPGDGLSPVAIDHPLGACMLVQRQVIDEVGALDEQYFMYSEEIDWCRRIRASGWTILLAPRARVIHHGGQSTGQVGRKMFIQLHRSRAQYFRRHHSARFVRMVARLATVAKAAALARSWASGGSQTYQERAEILADVAQLYRET